MQTAISIREMIRFRKPQKIALDDGRLLFSAISHVADRLILVGMHYFDEPIDYDGVSVRVLPAANFVRFETFAHRDYEPCVVLSAVVGEAEISIEISYRDRRWLISLEHEPAASSKWSLMTLFKHDYRLVPEFLRYYSALGVAHFHLYYNGPLDSIDWSFLSNSEVAKDADVTLYEWDIAYWWDVKRPAPLAVYTEQGFQHHAQPMAMNHHLHRLKSAGGYTFFVDVDEFVFTPRQILERYCDHGAPGILFQCWFAAPERDASYESFRFNDDTPLLISRKGRGSSRLKCLVNSAEVDLMGVHFPTLHLEKNLAAIDGHLHIGGFEGNPRPDQVPQDFVRMTKAEFVRAIFGQTR
jgi:hypothetical protein